MSETPAPYNPLPIMTFASYTVTHTAHGIILQGLRIPVSDLCALARSIERDYPKTIFDTVLAAHYHALAVLAYSPESSAQWRDEVLPKEVPDATPNR